jgi:predicted nucleic acid-binding protein
MNKCTLDGLSRDRLLVFDASVLINIAHSGICTIFFEALGCACLVERITWREITDHTKRYHLNTEIEDALRRGLIDVIDMSRNEATTFINLITAPHNSALDEGEAATIAVACGKDAIAVIDEKKGLRIAAEQLPPVEVLTTLDLFRLVETNLRVAGASPEMALYNSLSQARMRVPIEHEEWVLGQLSEDQIFNCKSLAKRFRCADRRLVHAVSASTFNADSR